MTRAEQQKLSEIKRHIEYNRQLNIRIAELDSEIERKSVVANALHIRNRDTRLALEMKIAELEGTLEEINYECDLAGVHKGHVATRVRELNGLYKQSKEKENYGN